MLDEMQAAELAAALAVIARYIENATGTALRFQVMEYGKIAVSLGGIQASFTFTTRGSPPGE